MINLSVITQCDASPCKCKVRSRGFKAFVLQNVHCTALVTHSIQRSASQPNDHNTAIAQPVAKRGFRIPLAVSHHCPNCTAVARRETSTRVGTLTCHIDQPGSAAVNSARLHTPAGWRFAHTPTSRWTCTSPTMCPCKWTLITFWASFSLLSSLFLAQHGSCRVWAGWLAGMLTAALCYAHNRLCCNPRFPSTLQNQIWCRAAQAPVINRTRASLLVHGDWSNPFRDRGLGGGQG